MKLKDKRKEIRINLLSESEKVLFFPMAYIFFQINGRQYK